MTSLVATLQEYQKNELLINHLIEGVIQERISKGFYTPREEWSPGSDKMIATFIGSAIQHQFKQAIELSEKCKDFYESSIL